MTRQAEGDLLVVHAQPEALSRLAMRVVREAPTWRSATAVGASNAMAEIRQRRPAGVISSIDVRAASGEPLLATVRREHPEITRVAVLDGEDDGGRQAASRSAHHVLGSGAGQPSEIGDLVGRTRDVLARISRPEVVGMVGDLSRLPSVPRTYLALVDAASNPDVDIGDVADIVQSDPSMTVKLLQLVNSAMFGFGKRIGSIHQAVNLVGLELIKGLALSAHVFAAMDSVPHANFSMERFQAYSLLVARLVRGFLPPGPDRELAFTAGLVNDIGQLVLAIRDPDGFARVGERAARERRAIADVEQDQFGVTHDEVGACLLARWDIPFPVVECVAQHRALADVRGRPSVITVALHAADALLGILLCNEPPSRLDVASIERARFADRLPIWRAQAEAAALEAR